MLVDILESSEGHRISKRFYLDENGEIGKDSYPHIKRFNSKCVSFDTISELNEIIKHNSDAGNCLLKGRLDRQLNNESRAGHTDPDLPTSWFVIDNDYINDVGPEQLLELMGIKDVDYIVQYSASAGVVPGKSSYHIFLLLDSEYSPKDIKYWLKQQNLYNPIFKQKLSLTRTNLSLRWPIDISVNQNDKLIYISPPLCGPGVEDILGDDRIQLVERKSRLLKLNIDQISEDVIDSAEKKAIADLRVKAGLPQKEISFRQAYSHEVFNNPERSVVTGVKEGNDFIYLNLNGGDSWGYYHPKVNSKVLHNFKGEPKYLIKELLPDYYKDAQAKSTQARAEKKAADKQRAVEEYLSQQTRYFERCKASGSRAYLAFRDRDTDQYYIGYHDSDARLNDFSYTSSKEKIRDYLKQYEQPKPEIIETWTYAFRPDLEVIFDPQKKFINKFHPSKYLLNAVCKEGLLIPSHICRLLMHVCGNDKEVMDHLVNWIAVIFQRRIRTQTAWILHGTTGTGKGLLFSEILRPLIGEYYCRSMTLPNLEDTFNKFTAETIVLFVDEVDTHQIRQIDKLTAKLKNMITEPKIAVRAMRADTQEATNYQNIIMASNQPNSMRIERNDRRFNVAPRQEAKLFSEGEDAGKFINGIREELPSFADYLMSYPISMERARMCLENEPKQQMQVITQTALKEVTQEIKDGNLGYFMDLAPKQKAGVHDAKFDGREIVLVEEYLRILRDATEQALKGKSHFLDHLDLFVLTQFLVGKMPFFKGSLASKLGHAGIVIGPKSDGKRSLGRGYVTRWNAPERDLEHWAKCLDLKIPSDHHADAA